MKKRIALLLALVMLMVPVLTACGGKGGNDSAGNNAAADNAEKDKPIQDVSDANKQQQTQQDEAATYKKSITLGLNGNLTSIDPQLNSNGTNDQITFMVQNHLLGFDWDTMEIVPELAESWEVEAADSYLFNLRKGVKFSNGEEFTADDVVWTLVDRPDAVQGTTQVKVWNAIEEIEVIDDYTLRMKLVAPNADWLHQMYHPNQAIFNREACEADPEEGHYIGTGGWIITGWAPNDYVKFERFDDSWVWEENGMNPTEEITFKYISEQSARSVALQNGEIATATDINYSDLPALEGDDRIEVMTYSVQTLHYYFFNMQNSVFAEDQNLRDAVAYAINYQDALEYMTYGLGEEATTMWGKAQFGYYDEFESPRTYDVEKAKAAIAASGQPNGCTMNLVVQKMYEGLATLFQAMLKEIGIEVVITVTDNAGFNTAMKEGTYDMAIFNISQRADGDRFTFIGNPANSTNRAHYDDPEMQEQFVAALATADDAERIELYKQIQETINTVKPYVPMFHGITNVGWAKGVTGAYWDPQMKNDFTNVRWAE